MLLLTFSSDNRFSPQSNFISLRFREISRVVNELWEHDNHSKFSKYSMPDKDEIDPNAESDIASNDEHLIIPEDVEVYEINGPYFFGIATKFEEIMARLGDRPKVRIIRMRKVPFIDSTGIHNLTSLCEMSQKEKITIVLSGVNEKVHKVLEKSGFYELLGEENICPNINVALERAKMIIQH